MLKHRKGISPAAVAGIVIMASCVAYVVFAKPTLDGPGGWEAGRNGASDGWRRERGDRAKEGHSKQQAA